jgi:branched-chain amino acid transport system permease protein
VTGGVDGIGGFDRPTIFGWEINNVTYSYIIILSAIGVYWLLENLLHSRFGRAVVAVRDHEGAAMALGVNAAWHKIVALIISAMLAGFAGNLYAFRELYINPLTFHLELAFLLLFMAIIGGVGSTGGAAMGAVVVVLLPEILSGIGSELYFLIYGLVTILVIIFVPGGLAGIINLLYQKLIAIFPIPTVGLEAEHTEGPQAESTSPAPPGIAPTAGQPTDAILKVEGITNWAKRSRQDDDV